MEEVTKREHVEVDGRRLLKRVKVLHPKPETLTQVLFGQLSHCIVKEVELEFNIMPIIDHFGDEVDICFTGDITATLRCHSWGEISNKGDKADGEEEKNKG